MCILAARMVGTFYGRQEIYGEPDDVGCPDPMMQSCFSGVPSFVDTEVASTQTCGDQNTYQELLATLGPAVCED